MIENYQSFLVFVFSEISLRKFLHRNLKIHPSNSWHLLRLMNDIFPDKGTVVNWKRPCLQVMHLNVKASKTSVQDELYTDEANDLLISIYKKRHFKMFLILIFLEFNTSL